MKKIIYFLCLLCFILFLGSKCGKNKVPDYTLPDASKNVCWDESFNTADKSLDGAVYVITIAPNSSNVFVGGKFIRAGNITNANHIAMWDTTTKTWSDMGGGVNGDVKAIAVDGQYVYVGGGFTTAGNISASNIARWDITNKVWASLGKGVNGAINAIAVSDLYIYAGGSFTAFTVGTPIIQLNNVARCTKSSQTWSQMANGIIGVVWSMLNSKNGELFVGGQIFEASYKSANNIVKWFGNAQWECLGKGLTGGNAMALAEGSNKLYIGGSFDIAGEKPAKYIAAWISNNLVPVGGNSDLVGDENLGYVKALAINNDELYVGGLLKAAGGTLVHNIAKWNGSVWSPLGTGVQGGTVYAIASSGKSVFVGGDFISVGEKPCPYFARWRLP